MSYNDKTENQQEAQQKRLAKLTKRRNAARDAALKLCFTTYEGRALLWWLLEIGRVNTQPFSIDPQKTAFQCGEMNVGNAILARLVEVNPEGYLAMLKEKANEHRSVLASDNGDSSGGRPGEYDSELGDNAAHASDD